MPPTPPINPSNLVGIGTASYNGWTFSPKMQTESIDGKPVQDQAKRTIVYWEWNISILDRITAPSGQTIDALITDARNKLLVQGGNFTYTNKGFGDLTINVGAKKDVMWGPVPTGFRYKLAGGNISADFIWSVRVCIPESCVSPAYQFKLMEANYRASYRTDISGYSHRNITGHIRIPQTRSSVTSRTLNDNANAYRTMIVPTVPDGFRRTDATFTISDDKCRLDYSINDDEVPGTAFPPPGIIEVTADHVISTRQTTPSPRWGGTISASYEVAKDVPKTAAFFYFTGLLADRLDKTRQFGRTVIARSLVLHEVELYGKRTAQCSFSYEFTATLQTILAASGLWSAVPNSDYQSWKTSLPALFSNYAGGYANLGFNNNDDLIVDLCQPYNNKMSGGFPPIGGGSGGVTIFPLQCPDAEQSWLDFKLGCRLDIDDNIVEMKALPLGSIQTQPPTNTVSLSAGNWNGYPAPPSGAQQMIANTAGYKPPIAGGTLLNTPQQRATPELAIILQGEALRVCWPIDAPTLAQLGEVTLVPANREGEHFFNTGQVASWLGLPINYACWSLRYTIPVMPASGLTGPLNPFLGYA